MHLLRAADVELVGELAVVGHEPRLVQRLVDRLAGVDAEQDVVGQVVVLRQVVGVARGHHRKAQPPRHVELALHAVALDLQAVALHLDEEVALAEGLVVPHGQVLGLGPPVVQEQLRELGADAPRKADQALAVLGEDLLVDPRLVVVAFEVRPRREPQQVAETRSRCGQQGQVIGVALVSGPSRSWWSDRSAFPARRRPRSRRSA